MSPIQCLVEASVYVDDLNRAEAFYEGVLGLRVIDREVGRHIFFQVGTANVLLVLNAEATLKGDHLPPHGARGPSHFALGIGADSIDAWRERLQEHGIAIEHEEHWPRGGHSLYFRDRRATPSS